MVIDFYNLPFYNFTQNTIISFSFCLSFSVLTTDSLSVKSAGMGGHYVLDEYGDRNVNFSVIFTSTITGKVNKSSALHHRHSLVVFMCKWLPLWQKDCRLNEELTQFPPNGNHHVENWCYSARVAQSESTDAPMLCLCLFSVRNPCGFWHIQKPNYHHWQITSPVLEWGGLAGRCARIHR